MPRSARCRIHDLVQRSTVLAATKFAEHIDADTNIVVLVDFENDSVRTSLEVARALGERLWGVRLDTSRSLVDRSLWNEMGDFDPRGVNPRLVRGMREALDRDGFERVKIVVSGGMNAERIEQFEEECGVPVDSTASARPSSGENDFGGRCADGRAGIGQGRPLVPAEHGSSAWPDRQRTGALIAGQLSIGSVERTTCIPAAAKRSNGVRFRRVVHSGHDDGRGAIFQEVRAGRRGALALVVALEQVVDRPPRSGSSPGRRRRSRRR